MLSGNYDYTWPFTFFSFVFFLNEAYNLQIVAPFTLAYGSYFDSISPTWYSMQHLPTQCCHSSIGIWVCQTKLNLRSVIFYIECVGELYSFVVHPIVPDKLVLIILVGCVVLPFTLRVVVCQDLHVRMVLHFFWYVENHKCCCMRMGRLRGRTLACPQNNKIEPLVIAMSVDVILQEQVVDCTPILFNPNCGWLQDMRSLLDLVNPFWFASTVGFACFLLILSNVRGIAETAFRIGVVWILINLA